MPNRRDSISRWPLLEARLAQFDFALGGLALVGIGLVVTLTVLPATRAGDIDGYRIVLGIVLIPIALLAFAAGHSMRTRDRGRWVLQTMTLVAVLALVGILAAAAIAAPRS
jgi:hypothetical protein